MVRRAMTDTTTNPQEQDGPRAKRAVAILAWGQAVLGAQLPVHFILGGLAGQLLAENPALSTLPISLIVFSAMLSAPVISGIMGRFGRRTGFLIGALGGVVGGLTAAGAVVLGSFPLLLAASLATGVYMAAHNLYRFAAADLASPAFRPKAISWVLAGGLVGAVLGPEIVIRFEDWLAPVPFAGAYLAVALVALLGAVPLLFLDIPPPPRGPRGTRAGRSWREIFADRRVPVAMLCAMIAYALMNLVMTSTPLAMHGHGFGTGGAAEVVRVHVVAMFAPSFVTGHLIARFGAPRIIAFGLALMALAAATALAGIAFVNFAVALALVGIGWNFGFIGATTMLAASHLPEERARVQGLNDFLVFGLVTVASFSSGALMATSGWAAVNWASLPLLAVAGLALGWLAMRR